MASQQNDTSRVDFANTTVTTGTATTLLGTDSSTQQSSPGVVIPRPFSYQPALGYNHVSITAIAAAGVAGTITVQVTDFGGVSEGDVYGLPAAAWCNTAYTIVISATGGYNLQVPNIAFKFFRLSFTGSAGNTAGAIQVAVTLRANGRS